MGSSDEREASDKAMPRNNMGRMAIMSMATRTAARVIKNCFIVLWLSV